MPFNRLNHSILGEIRPRFALKIDCDPETALTYVEDRLYQDKTVSGERSGNLIFVRTPSWESHYWSPEMTVRIEVEEFTDFTQVSCLVGPKQVVWAMWAFIYSAIAIATTFAGIFGFVQYQQDGSSPWLYGIPVGVVLISSAFIAAKIGQRKGRDQMLHLISFLYHNLDDMCTVDRIDN